jgi:iron-sulfur cluster assembly protein
MAITITPAAVAAIRGQMQKRGTPDAALRVGIKGGGCTGFAYLFEWADGAPGEHDHVFAQDGVKVFIDAKSMVYLEGIRLDYVSSLMKSGFKLDNPNAKGSCGCGESVNF